MECLRYLGNFILHLIPGRILLFIPRLLWGFPSRGRGGGALISLELPRHAEEEKSDDGGGW